MPHRQEENVLVNIRIIGMLLRKVPFKQIAYACDRSQSHVSYIKRRYTRVSESLRLNAEGKRLVNRDQIDLPFPKPKRKYNGQYRHRV